MIDDIAARFPFWATAILLAVGLYGMMGKRSLIKKIIGLNVFQSAIILFFISQSIKAGAGVPILTGGTGPVDPDRYVNPLPHVMMLGHCGKCWRPGGCPGLSRVHLPEVP
jgi:multicomponent Na+:H+ antiporter subunit C